MVKSIFSKKQLGEDHPPRILEIPKKTLRKVLVSVSPTATPLRQGSHKNPQNPKIGRRDFRKLPVISCLRALADTSYTYRTKEHA
ncbi:hypothetical protein Y032_0048g1568 [Ancylostoma ceylanicum]|uniref:Uncharacterized protein n=1 Tax=Ancylostoma ceylanicum TaxID=53326 RepID=A0A016UBP8_9BILA|nr:hypothetical protein Y032_0048g1568 [Ancylostoma ceylanicum]